MAEKQIIEDLGNNLILRRSTKDDAEALGKFQGTIQVDPGEDFAENVALWIHELLSGDHPIFDPGDFTIVEDTSTGEIVSSLCLIDQTWAYEGIPFPVGRPELVATHPDYRRRGLIRKQFDTVHAWSAARGHKLQFITGIPWYYRQFGYEMALNLGGQRIAFKAGIPKIKEGEEEKFSFREAGEADIPFLEAVYRRGVQRSMLSCVWGEDYWRYQLTGRLTGSDRRTLTYLIETPEGEKAGYITVVPRLFGGSVALQSFELAEGFSWLEATPAVLHKLIEIGGELAEKVSSDDKPAACDKVNLHLGADHPCYHMAPQSMPLVHDPYAFYMRVPDLPDFIRTIAPALEARLADSYAVGYTGELKLNFYTDGLILHFEKGKLESVGGWPQPEREQASAHFPDLTFLQLLFGYHSYDEIRNAFADCASFVNEAEVLLRILFPKKPSHVRDLG